MILISIFFIFLSLFFFSMAIVNHFGSVCIVTAMITKAAMAMFLFIFVLRGNICMYRLILDNHSQLI